MPDERSPTGRAGRCAGRSGRRQTGHDGVCGQRSGWRRTPFGGASVRRRSAGASVGRAVPGDRTRLHSPHEPSFSALARTSSTVPARKKACSGNVSVLPSRISLKLATVSLIDT